MNQAIALLLISGMLLGGDAAGSTIDQSVARSKEAAAITAASIAPEITPEEAAKVVSDAGLRFEHDWQVLYYAKLAEVMGSFSMPEDPDPFPFPMFNILDLDRNGTPELLFSDGAYHAAPGDLYIARQDGLILLKRFGGYGEFQYDFERNYIRGAYTGQGASFTHIYRFEDSVIREVIDFYTFNGYLRPEMGGVFQINGQDFPETIYNAAYEPYTFEAFFAGEGLVVVDPNVRHPIPRHPRTLENGFVVRKYFITPGTVESALLES